MNEGISFQTVSKFCYCLIPDGSVLIFVTKKANSEELAANLKKNDFEGT